MGSPYIDEDLRAGVESIRLAESSISKGGLMARLVEFKEPGGTPVAVNPDFVERIHPAVESHDGQTKIVFGPNSHVTVQGSYNEVLRLLNSH